MKNGQVQDQATMKGAGKIFRYGLKTRMKISSAFKCIKSHRSEDDSKDFPSLLSLSERKELRSAAGWIQFI